MIPDMLRIVADYLRDAGLRAVTKPPDNTQTQWVRIHQIGAPQDPVSPADYIVRFHLQFDCYAGADAPNETHGQPEANDLVREVRELIGALPAEEIDDADISSARILNDFPRLDDNFKPARDNWILEAEIVAHAREAVS